MMYHEFLKRDAIPEILAIRPNAKDSIVLCDAGGLAAKFREIASQSDDWHKRHYDEAAEKLEKGDPSLVSQSDEFIRKLEEEQFVSRAWKVQNDVVGALPDVPAMIAGQPMNMRRRVRTKKPQGPLVLFLETTGSGSISSSNLRGAAMLALVRLLAPQRVIELYVCTTYGRHSTMNAILCKVETTPLDMGRACQLLVRLSWMAGLGHDHLTRVLGENPGSWSYGTPDLERKYCGEIFKRFLHSDADIIFVPAAYSDDPSLDNYHLWLKNMLKKYGGDSVVREDDEVVADTNFMENFQ